MSLKAKGQKTSQPAEVVKKKSAKRKTESHESYIFKVLKQVHPKLRISKQAMAIMQSSVVDTFERTAQESNRLLGMSKRATLGAREIQNAVRLVLPGELSKHAISEGTKAVMKYNTKKAKDIDAVRSRRVSLSPNASST